MGGVLELDELLLVGGVLELDELLLDELLLVGGGVLELDEPGGCQGGGQGGGMTCTGGQGGYGG